jgi:hypothetical protein
MQSRRAIAVGVLSLIVTCVTAVPASAQAQQPPEVGRPYRGLFGGQTSSESPHSLVATGSVYAAYDDNIYEAITERQTNSPWYQESGTYQGATAGLSYAFEKDGERFDFRAQSSAQAYYYRHEDDADLLPAYQGSLEFGARLTRSMSLTVRENVGYSSVYDSTLAPQLDDDLGSEIGVAPDPDLGLFQERAIYSATRVALSQGFGRYTSLGVSYLMQSRTALSTEVEDSPLRDYTSHTATAGIQYARPMTRNATLKLGYGLRWSDRERTASEPELMHNIIAGIDYSRALSFSRRTFFSFGTGSAITVSEEVPAADGERRVQAWLLGNAALVHEMGRTWTADLRYTRGFRTREGFDQLYFTDALTASISGLVSRRLSFGAAATWAESSEQNDLSKNYSNQSAVAQATYGITSYLGVYARYVYLKDRYDEGVLLDPRFPQQLDRQGVRVGLTTSIPLIR